MQHSRRGLATRTVSRRGFVTGTLGAAGAALVVDRRAGLASSAGQGARTSAAASAQSTPEPTPPDYDGRAMTSSSYGGAVEEMQTAAVFEPFERTTGADVTLVTLYSADALARITAERDNPQLDVVQFSGGQEKVAAAEGLTQPLDLSLVPNLSRVVERFRDPENRWATVGAIAEGILYRTDKVSSPPTSWADFWSPEVQGHVAFPDISNGYGMNFLVMAARINGGGEENIDPGFAALKEIAPEATIFKTAAEVVQLFSQGDIWMMPYDSAAAFRAEQQGLPVAFATPIEGAPAVFLTASVVAGGDNVDVANSLINFFLTPDAQVLAAQELRYAPVLSSITLEPDVASGVPPIDQLLGLNSDAINTGRPEWTERWNREIARS